MPITRFRYTWEPTTYHQADAGAPKGGGNPPLSAQQGEDGDGEGNQENGESKGGDGDGAPDAAKTLTQSDVDRIVAKRLTEEKEREAKRTADAVKKAEVETARKNGEWQKVAEGREAEIATLNQRVVELETQIAERDTALLRAQIAAKHQLPDRMVDRLRGATAEEMEADAKELAKLVVKRNGPNTEAGRVGATPKTPTIEQEKQAQLATGRYRSIA